MVFPGWLRHEVLARGGDPSPLLRRVAAVAPPAIIEWTEERLDAVEAGSREMHWGKNVDPALARVMGPVEGRAVERMLTVPWSPWMTPRSSSAAETP